MKKISSVLAQPRIIFGCVALLMLAFILSGTMSKKAPSIPGTLPTSLSETDISAMTTKLDTLIKLPDEKPKTEVLRDTATLKKTQAFLENAEDGDVLFLYFTAEVAFLYRPSTNTIIATGPLHNGPPPAAAGDAPTR